MLAWKILSLSSYITLLFRSCYSHKTWSDIYQLEWHSYCGYGPGHGSCCYPVDNLQWLHVRQRRLMIILNNLLFYLFLLQRLLKQLILSISIVFFYSLQREGRRVIWLLLISQSNEMHRTTTYLGDTPFHSGAFIPPEDKITYSPYSPKALGYIHKP